MSNNNGFSSAREKSQKIASALRDISVLIGEPSNQTITLETGDTITPGLGNIADSDALAKRASDIEQGIFNMIVLGEFKNGKSTLLNAMLGGETLPAKATPCTAIITILVYGDSDKIAVYESDKDNPRILTWEKFNTEFQLKIQDQETIDKEGYIDRFREIEYAQIECHNRLCDNGVRLIDSPGLKENINRTRVTTKFLKQSQAVIFVLNATRILSEDEKDFITSNFEPNKIDNVFFVINKINLIGKNDIDDVKEYVKTFLKNYFLDDKGKFDEQFYNRRVFFVNAKGALDAHLNPSDNVILQSSGVPALEKELEIFLASPEKIRAAFESTVQLLSSIISQCREEISRKKVDLDQPLNELEKRREQTETMLQELEKKKNEIQRTIEIYGGMIKQKIYASLMGYVEEMHDSWSVDSQRYVKIDEVNIGNILKSFIGDKKAKEKITQAISKESKNYISIKLDEWSKKIPTIIEDDIIKMMTELEGQLEDFVLQIDKIKNVFTGGNTEDIVDVDKKKVQKTIQLVYGIATLDFSNMTGSIMGKGDWPSFFGRIIQEILVLTALTSLFGGPIALIAYAVIEAILITGQKQNLKKRIKETMGEKIYESLKKELPQKQDEIYKRIDEQFKQLSKQFTTTLQQQIDETRTAQDVTIKQKQNASFSVEQEKSRLDDIETKLVELFDRVSMLNSSKV